MYSLAPFSSIFELLRAFPDEQSCIIHLEKLRWNGVVVSPFDAASTVYKLAGNKYKCSKTNKYFNVRTQTIFEGTKLPLQKWFLAIYLFTSHKKGISSYQLASDLDITQKSSWFVLQRIRYAMEHEAFVKYMDGNVQLDEAFIGGKNKNRHHDKKVEQSQGRSFKDKTPVLGMIQVAEKEYIHRPHKVIANRTVTEVVITKPAVVKCQVIENTSKEVIQPILVENIQLGANVVSDEWKAYAGLNALFNHQIVDHSRKQYVNEAGGTTNNMENFWTHLKRGWVSTYSGRITKKHLQKYVSEFTFRTNTKDKATDARFNVLLQAANNRRLTYKSLIH